MLVDAAGYPYGDPPALFRLLGTPVLAPLLTRLSPRWMYASNLRQVYVDDARVTDALVDRYYDLTRRTGNRRAFLARALVTDSFPFSAIRGLRAPTLVMWGAGDRWIPRAMADTFATYIPGARVVMYDGVGHLPMEESPRAAPPTRARSCSAGAEPGARQANWAAHAHRVQMHGDGVAHVAAVAAGDRDAHREPDLAAGLEHHRVAAHEPVER